MKNEWTLRGTSYSCRKSRPYKLHETDKINMFRPVENYKSLNTLCKSYIFRHHRFLEIYNAYITEKRQSNNKAWNIGLIQFFSLHGIVLVDSFVYSTQMRNFFTVTSLKLYNTLISDDGHFVRDVLFII